MNIYHIYRQKVTDLLQRIHVPRLAGAMRSIVGRVATLSMQTDRRLGAIAESNGKSLDQLIFPGKIDRKPGIWMHGFAMFSVSLACVILLETIGHETDQNWSFPR